MISNKKRNPRVVIVGGGFGGVAAAKKLKKTDVDVVLIDRRNYHLFQPLLYQVATAALNPSDIAAPIRKIFSKQKNLRSILGEVENVDLANRKVYLKGEPVEYDYLVLAAGATHSYFGNDQWSKFAPGLKTLDDAVEIRRKFLLSFEAAEVETDPEARRACLTFVVVGGGPTGCEMAGAMAEVARSIPDDFREVDTKTASIILIQGSDRVLDAFPKESSDDALKHLEEMGVEVILNQFVTEVSADGVKYGEKFIATNNVFWAAGVKASPLGESLGVELDNAGRVIVEPDLSVTGYPKVFVIGDQAAAKSSKTGKLVPGVAQGAMQGGDFVGNIIHHELKDETWVERGEFSYFDKGNLATIGRNKAVADIRGFKLKGFLAWFIWVAVHVLFLVNFRSKISVVFSWSWTYFLGSRGARLITGKSDYQIKRPSDSD
ncbi:MAG: NAD(P)/FAD-dependent oxidoreductase [Rubritalea sp.]|tara:strand:- start:982 stop:2280 length:1299 start_codon:yes stop_codon:yes gene_type:complete